MIIISQQIRIWALTQSLTLLQVMWNISDKSAPFCRRIIKAGLHADLFTYLKSDTLSPVKLSGPMEEIKKIFVQGQLGTLHNVVQKAETAREDFRDCGAVEILQPFRQQTSAKLQVTTVVNGQRAVHVYV